MIGFVAGVGILFCLVVLHELGHLVVARLCGIPVVSFSVGFGPRALEWRRGGIAYRLGVIPLGGYIRYGDIDGPARRPGALAAVYLGGPLANVAIAAFLLVVAERGVFAGLAQAAGFGVEIVRAFANLFASADLGQLGGPILVTRWAGAAAAAGLAPLLRLTAVLSMNLAVLNLVPLPVLDGGRALMLAAESACGQRLKAPVERMVAVSGFAILILLMLVALANDLARLAA
jgi:membrane-associated protease RseP (regulator of RpoE activity)